MGRERLAFELLSVAYFNFVIFRRFVIMAVNCDEITVAEKRETMKFGISLIVFLWIFCSHPYATVFQLLKLGY